MKKNVYVVDLISRSIQTKLVYARSHKEAQEIADSSEWNEKEEMLDSEINVRKAVIRGAEKKSKYPDYQPSSYVWISPEESVRFNEIDIR